MGTNAMGAALYFEAPAKPASSPHNSNRLREYLVEAAQTPTALEARQKSAIGISTPIR